MGTLMGISNFSNPADNQQGPKAFFEDFAKDLARIQPQTIQEFPIYVSKKISTRGKIRKCVVLVHPKPRTES